ncbi:MAG: hypothetical protein K2J99_08740 [Lachnospiraceae bacterium]|nr:hypothetical protein [Lachnospiraceae bacterium]
MKLKEKENRLRAAADKIINRKLFVFAVSAVFVLLASFYYYGLLCEYPPNGEEIQTIASAYSHLYLGTDFVVHDILYSLCAFFAACVGGMSYFAVRLCFTILYAILLCGTIFLSMGCKKGQGVKLYLLPLIALLSVALYPIADNATLFWDSGAEDLVYLWPYVYHYPARIYALICLIIASLATGCEKRNKKILYSVILIVVCLYAIKATDLIYYIAFLCPAAIVLVLHLMRDDKWRKYVVYVFVGFMIALLLSRFAPISFVRQLWTKEAAHVYGTVYGGTNWISIDLLGEHLLSYVELIMMNFNIQMSGAPVISLHTVVYICKILILIAGYVLMFHIVKCSITGKCREYHYDCIDEIVAWSYLVVSCVYIFTGFGHVVFARYFPIITTVMTILICRNIEVFPRVVRVDFLHKIEYKRVLVFFSTMVLCLCNMGKVWTYHAPNEYDDDLRAIVGYIESTDLGYTVAPYWLYPRVSALSEGNVMAWETEGKVRYVFGEDAEATYLITHNFFSADDNTFTIYEHCDTYEEMCEYYSEPSDIIFFDKLQLVIYEDGIKTKE